MKIHARKKAYRRWLKSEAQAGRMNNAAGQMVARASAVDNAMKRDFYPQEGK